MQQVQAIDRKPQQTLQHPRGRTAAAAAAAVKPIEQGRGHQAASVGQFSRITTQL